MTLPPTVNSLLDKQDETPVVQKPSALRFVELILGALILLSIVLSLFLVPGHGPLLVVSLQSLTLLYGYLGFAFFNNIPFRKILKKSSYKGINAGRILGGIGTGITLAACLVGALFKLMSWPGANFMLLSGLFLFIPIVIVGGINYARNHSPYYLKIFKRVGVIGSLAVVLYYIPWQELKYRNHPAFLKAAQEYREDPSAEGYERLEEERRKAYDKEN